MAQMITGARKGGAVLHYMREGARSTLCGRYMIPGMGDSLRDCRSCVRIGHLVGQGASDLETLAAKRYNGSIERVREIVAKPRNTSQLMFLRECLRDGDELDPSVRALYMLWHDAWNGKALFGGAMWSDPKRATRSNPNAGMIDPKNAKPARSILSPNQIAALNKMSAYENSLIADIRELEGKERPELELMDLTALKTRKDIDAAFTRLSASIDKLKARRNELKWNAPKPAPAAVESGKEMRKGGVYEFNGELYRYAIAQRSGYAYALKWNGSEWDYDSAKGIVRKLTPEMAISAERASEFGHTHHCCVFCSRPLNDPRSEDAGYGSTCADNYGLPWG